MSTAERSPGGKSRRKSTGQCKRIKNDHGNEIHCLAKGKHRNIIISGSFVFLIANADI